MAIKRQGQILVEKGSDGCTTVKAMLFGFLRRDGGLWESVCEPLDLVTSGATQEEAIRNTGTAINMWFESCLRRGTLEAALTELGWEAESISKLRQPIMDCETEPTPEFHLDKRERKRWSGHLDLHAA